MKVIHAVWERRNMGIECYELQIENGDTSEMIQQFEADHPFQYAVVKVPVDQPELLFQIQKLGYVFMETLTSCHYVNKMPYDLLPVQERLLNHLQCEPISHKEADQIYDRIRAGLFMTDRISLDPRFTKEQSANRYIGWIHDELERNAILYQIAYQGHSAGFFGIRPPEHGACYAFLGGIYPEYQRLGLGVLMNCLEIEKSKQMGAFRTDTAFSSNNQGAYAVHLSMKYVLDKVEYLLIKHQETE